MDNIWTDFLNSDWHDWKEGKQDMDRLPLSKWQYSFLERYELKATVPAPADQLNYLHTLRSELHRLAARLSNGTEWEEQDILLLDRYIANSSVRGRLLAEQGQPVLHYIPENEDWFSVAAEIVTHFVRTLDLGEGKRIRFCDNPDCRWVFYDDTRSRTKKYCDDKLCGNLMKVRRFRAKRKAESDQ